MSKYFTAFGEEMPPRRSLAHIQDEPDKPPANHDLFLSEIEYARPLPTLHSNYTEIKETIFSELESAWVGGETVEQVCRRIKPRVDNLFQAE